MIKLGTHTCSYIDNFAQDETLEFPLLKEMGIEVVEFSILSDYSKERARYLKSKLAQYNLKGKCCSALPEGCDFASLNKEEVKNANKYMFSCIEFCKDMGSESLSGVLYSPWGKTNPNTEKSEKHEIIAQNFSSVAKFARENDISINFEVLNRYETDVINTLADGANLLEKIACENIFLLADTFHMNIEEVDMIYATERYSKYIGNIHITESNRDFPRPDNLFWEKFLGSLKTVDYNGDIIFECAIRNDTEVGRAFAQRQNLLEDKTVTEKMKLSSFFINKILTQESLSIKEV
ncbi:MAG: sugar phosphate isomerase/epimerase family protein [Spirochaetales bacterium]